MEPTNQDPQPEKEAARAPVLASFLAFFAGARAALVFLTRIPCGKAPVTPQALAWAAAWFPAVGCLLGLAGASVYVGLAPAGSMVASVATVSFLALITGAFHEDGLADSADALGGAYDRPKLFAILKDSRIGSFGATALFLVLLLRVTALAQLGSTAVGGLVLGQTLSRATPVWLMAAMPYATPPETASSSRLVKARPVHALAASLLASIAAWAAVTAELLPLRGVLVALAAASTVVALCGWRFHVRAGGLTGDFLGATQQLTDATILVALAASC
jgi:adenosylcobinamide-GDP ribazoletransferase